MLGGEVLQGRHEGIVSNETLLKANEVKTYNGVWTKRRDFENVPLKNFKKCEFCGSSYCGYLVKQKKGFGITNSIRRVVSAIGTLL